MTSSFDRIKQVRAEYLDLVKTEGKKALKEFVKEFFDATGGTVKALRWRQYTPYFNDGDACEFHVHDAYEFHVHDAYFQLTDQSSLPEGTHSDYDDDFLSTCLLYTSDAADE